MAGTATSLVQVARGRSARLAVLMLCCWVSSLPMSELHKHGAEDSPLRSCGHGDVHEIMTRRLDRFHRASREVQQVTNAPDFAPISRNATRTSRGRVLIDLGSLPFASGDYDAPPVEESDAFRSDTGFDWGSVAPPEAPAPIRFHLEYRLESLEARQQEKATFLRDRLVPAMVASLQRYVLVKRPVQHGQPLLLPRYCQDSWGVEGDRLCREVQRLGSCLVSDHDPEFFGPYLTCSSPDSSACVVSPGGSGVPNADFILYVSADSNSCGPGTAAFAGACELDPTTLRPVAGEVNFCPEYILTEPKNWGYMLDTAVHEMMHALVMHDALFPFYVDANLQRLENVVSVLPESRGVSPVGITTPNVVAAIQTHRGCSELIHMPLENEGGRGTALAHWELSAVLDELMVGVSTVRGFQRQVMSNITLALLQDSGWYTPAWEAAGWLSWGRNTGCTFASACATQGAEAGAELPYEFCTEKETEMQTASCAWDLSAVGTCQRSMLSNGCAMRLKFTDYVCTDSGQSNPLYLDSNADWGEAFGPSARCLGEPRSSPIHRIFMQGEGPTRSERRNGSYSSLPAQAKRPMGAGCYDMGCRPDGELIVTVAGVSLACPEGGYIELAASSALRAKGFLSGKLGPCPPAARICPHLSCDGQCGEGRCWKGRCYCHVGTDGSRCDGELCDPSNPNACHHLEGHQCSGVTRTCAPLITPTSNTTGAMQRTPPTSLGAAFGSVPIGQESVAAGQLPVGTEWTLYSPESVLPFSPVFWGSIEWQAEVMNSLQNISRVELGLPSLQTSNMTHDPEAPTQWEAHRNSSCGKDSNGSLCRSSTAMAERPWNGLVSLLLLLAITLGIC